VLGALGENGNEQLRAREKPIAGKMMLRPNNVVKPELISQNTLL
jgi:hypothetical protein